MNFDSASSIYLEDDVVRLSPLLTEDYDLLKEIAFAEPELLTFSPKPINSPELLKVYVQEALIQRESGIRYPFLIFDKRSEKVAGCTSFGNISNANARIEIGWTWIGRQFQRTGLNRHMKYLMLQFAFEKLNFQRVELKTDSRNELSRTAILGIGAKYEGRLRSHTLMFDGFRRDTVYYSILANEWPKIKSSVFKGMQ